MDLSDLPALIGAFAYGPISGVLIELVKNVLQLLVSSTGGMGELADFIMGSSLVVTAGLIYQTKKAAVAACLIASVIMRIVAAIVNRFILFPTFETFMPLEQLIASFGGFIPSMQTELNVLLFNVFPFNLLKRIGISIAALLIYKPLASVLKRDQK